MHNIESIVRGFIAYRQYMALRTTSIAHYITMTLDPILTLSHADVHSSSDPAPTSSSCSDPSSSSSSSSALTATLPFFFSTTLTFPAVFPTSAAAALGCNPLNPPFFDPAPITIAFFGATSSLTFFAGTFFGAPGATMGFFLEAGGEAVALVSVSSSLSSTSGVG
jgi:hypothetical protein